MAEPGRFAEAETTTPARRGPRPRTMMLGIVIVIVLGIVVPPFVNVNRYRGDIARSISNAVGRPVTVGQVELRLLPQPGFDLHNVEVGDDTSISSEYLLRADAVTAYLRLSSLWRGRLEIARLSLTDPSLNVVRAEDGRWNLETLLSRTTQTPSAPTAQAHPENARRRFPYIEATGGRINFKFGLEKKAFTFTDADFALWLASENNWNMRLEAKPVRVDTRVTDTGTLKLSGSFQRNSTLRYTPVKFNVSWRDAQLGQMTKLLTGRDRGWRGGTTVELNATGTPADLALTSDLRVDDFRRYDISSGGAMRLAAHCTGHYFALEEKLASIDCAGPVGKGLIRLSGTAQRFSAPFFDLGMSGHGISMESVMALVRHAKRDLPEDLSAGGTTDFAFQARRAMETDARTLWSGGGNTDGVVLKSQALGPDLNIGALTYAIAPPVQEKPKRTMRAARIQPASNVQPTEVSEFELNIPSFPIALGAEQPTTAQATVNSSGFKVAVAGDAELARTLQVARALGIETPRVAASGAAHLDLHVDGRWTGFEAPFVSGTAQLKNVRADVPGIIETVTVSAASASVDKDGLALQNVSAAFAKGPSLTGSVNVPRNCTEPCAMTFVVHADELSPERLNQLLNPKLRNRPWYNFFMPRPADQGDPLQTAAVSGEFTIDRWNMEGVVASHVAGKMKIAEKRLAVTDLRADILGGQHTGAWDADFSGNRPVYSGRGKLTHINLAQLSTAMQDAWATGTADVSYQLKMTGLSADELKGSASGLGDFVVRDGTLRHMALDNKAGVLKVAKFDGTLSLHDGNFVVSDAKLQSGGAVYTVQGTATWKRQLDFKLTDASRAYGLSGTLDRPEVKQAPATEAALKP